MAAEAVPSVTTFSIISRMVSEVCSLMTCRRTVFSFFSTALPFSSSTSLTTYGCSRYPPLTTAATDRTSWIGVIRKLWPKAEDVRYDVPYL